MPPSAEVTVPVPVPPLLTVSVNRGALKVAVSDRDAFMVTVQVSPETPSQPLQLPKVDPPLALAVSVTSVPLRSEARRVGQERRPRSAPDTEPVTVPPLLTVLVNRGEWKGAETERNAFMVSGVA